MIKILIITTFLSSLIFAGTETKVQKKLRIEAQLKKDMAMEKKFAKEQTFYSGANYDLTSSEIDPKSLEHINAVEVDELDMDSVYD